MTLAPWQTKSRQRMLVASTAAFLEIIWRFELGFYVDLQVNATRRSINLSVYLVFDLETGRFKFLGENLLAAGGVKIIERAVNLFSKLSGL